MLRSNKYPAFSLCTENFTTPEQLLKTSNKGINFRSAHRIDILVRVILTTSTVALLLTPTAVLSLVPGYQVFKVGLILVFTSLFSLSLGISTKVWYTYMACSKPRNEGQTDDYARPSGTKS